MHASGTQLQNQQQHVNVSITRCIEDHSPQTKNASKSMDRAKVVDTRGANEDHLHVMQTCATLPLTTIEIVPNHVLSFIVN